MAPLTPPSPCVKSTNHKQAASLAKSVSSCTRRRKDRRRKQRRAMEMGCCPNSEREAVGFCISRCGAAECQCNDSERHPFNETPKKRVPFEPEALQFRKKLGLRTHRSGLLDPLIFMSAVRRLQNLRTSLKKRHLNNGSVAAEMHGSWPKSCSSSKRIWTKKEQHSSHLRKFGVFLRH